jgi:CDP-paratose synthetase
MNILITGSTGFLGSHLSRALLTRNHSVFALKRSFSDVMRIRDIENQITFYDIDKVKIEAPFVEHKIDVVIHAATFYGRGENSISLIEQSNVLFPLQLLELAEKYGCTAFFNTDTFFNTDSPSYGYLNNYTLSKKHFKNWFKSSQPDSRLKRINLRLQHVFGPNDNEDKFIPWVINQFISEVKEIPLTSGEQKRDFIFIDDVISAYLQIIKNLDDITGYWESDLGLGDTTTLKQFLLDIQRVYKEKFLRNSLAKLNFGALEYRTNEFFDIKEDIENLSLLGWQAKIDLKEGINRTLANMTGNKVDG